MAIKIIHMCDSCGKTISEKARVEDGYSCAAFHVEFVDLTVSGFVSDRHSCGHWHLEDNGMLFCRECFNGKVKSALKTLGLSI